MSCRCRLCCWRCVIVLWLWLKTRASAWRFTRSAATPTRRARRCSRRFHPFLTYVLAGGCYGLAGVFISAQTGSGDPLVGNPMLLQIFTAVVLGGTLLGGGRGGPVGTVFGAYILMMRRQRPARAQRISLLLHHRGRHHPDPRRAGVLAQPDLGARHAAALRGVTRSAAWRAGIAAAPDRRRRSAAAPPIAAWGVRGAARRRLSGVATPRPCATPCRPMSVSSSFIVVTELWLGNAVFHWRYCNSLMVLSGFLAILALGQGTVILTGGLDLSCHGPSAYAAFCSRALFKAPIRR